VLGNCWIWIVEFNWCGVGGEFEFEFGCLDWFEFGCGEFGWLGEFELVSWIEFEFEFGFG
jgi:hypothetical protein